VEVYCTPITVELHSGSEADSGPTAGVAALETLRIAKVIALRLTSDAIPLKVKITLLFVRFIEDAAAPNIRSLSLSSGIALGKVSAVNPPMIILPVSVTKGSSRSTTSHKLMSIPELELPRASDTVISKRFLPSGTLAGITISQFLVLPGVLSGVKSTIPVTVIPVLV